MTAVQVLTVNVLTDGLPAVLGSLAIIAALFAIPALHEPFGIVPLSAAEWAVVVALVPIPAIVAETGKAILRWRARRATAGA